MIPLVRAAQYVRKSTEHQHYSLPYQQVTNAAYASEHGFEIVRTFTDAGISGLTFEKRMGLRDLLATIMSDTHDFAVVLVLDVSRWGRFQDPDEAAHYEFLCRSAGVRVRYTAEIFQDDGTLTSSLMKHLKRAMAAEYSRELSIRTTNTQRKLAQQGFWMGGQAPYGMVRRQLKLDGTLGRKLKAYERPNLRGQRTVLVPGDPHEVGVVRKIFRMYVRDEKPVIEIAKLLSQEEPLVRGKPWSARRTHLILRNEAYAGTYVTGRSNCLLGERRLNNPDEWVRVPGAFEPIVSPASFAAAQRRAERCNRRVTDAELVRELKTALKRHGKLSEGIIKADRGCHCPGIYRKRFGDLEKAYALAGYQMSHRQKITQGAGRMPRSPNAGLKAVPDEAILAPLRELLIKYGYLSRELIRSSPNFTGMTMLFKRFGSLGTIYDLVGYVPDDKQRAALERGQRRLRRSLADRQLAASASPDMSH